MDDITRILIVEDSFADAEFNKREAIKALGNCDFELVETESDFLEKLDSFKPHLILSDYSMPNFDGLTALSLALKHAPDTPVIMVTGSVNEDTAVECMKAGAANYVIKQHVKRLGSAIKHALEERKIKIEHRLAQTALIESEKRYKALFQLSPVGIVLQDSNGKILNVNETYCRISGYTAQELIGKSIDVLAMGNDELSNIEENTRRILTGDVLNNEVKNKRKDGKPINIELTETAITLDDGSKGIMSIANDITERQFRENIQKMQYNIASAVITAGSLYELYEAVRFELAQLIDVTNFYIAFFKPETGMMQAPFEIEEKTSVTEWPAHKSLSGQIIKQQKSLFLTKKQISDMAHSGLINQIGTPSEVWLGVPLFNGDKAVGVMVVQSYDNPNAYNQDSMFILEHAARELSNYIGRKEAEQNAKKLSNALEQSPVSIIITDINGIIEYVNPKFTEISGYPASEAIGFKTSILRSGSHDEVFYKDLWDTILAGNNWQGEMKNKKKDGSYYWENAIISPVKNQNGVITHFVAVKEDITEKKQFIADLKVAKEKAEESDRLKTAFLQNISHEIRTPLNGILGFSELLVQDWTTPEDRIEYNEAIQISGKRLVEIISNVLDISIIETGQIILNPESFKLNSLIIDLYNFYRNQALIKGLQFNYDLENRDENFTITADPVRINQIMTNLLNNALKYTKTGAVSFGYSIGDGEIIFRVSDTGIGIDAVHHNRIFTRFFQAENSSARNYEGAGLGLSISHGLVIAMGGKIWFESESGKGTTFFFSIPVRDLVKPIVENQPHNLTVPTNDIILIADDDDTSYLLLMTTLKRRKVGIMRAENGIDAVELVKKHENIRLVLMDVKMPGMDGFEATRIIKSLKPDLPVIIQTAYAFSEDHDSAFKYGCDDYLSKPIATEKLYQLFDNYLGKEV
ncbi:MAG: hypothetical protein CVU14_03340 [Bacteroidetes bacterium HGW-Bacteroidetes-9]|jgi:PAS domain S-box-containing protein|nr:MAG: hypothetical protein CVU14_03340 [Bacteroidetes bacterium HGW-Bacteroidetes-9]